MRQNKSSNAFRSIAWVVIFTQLFTGSAFADPKSFSKATLANQVASDRTPPTGDTRRIDELSIAKDLVEIACRFGDKCLANPGKLEDAVAALYNYPPYVQLVDPSRKTFLRDGVITIPGKGQINEILVCLRSDTKAMKKFGPKPELTARFAVKINTRPSEQAILEPLIGHGFTDKELDAIEIIPAKNSEAFKDVLNKLDGIIRASDDEVIDGELKDRLLKTLAIFTSDTPGYRIGAVKSRYDNKDRYYLGFGTSRSIGVGTEFFDPKSRLYKHRFEAVFHELFHAARDSSLEGRDKEQDDIVAHYRSMSIAALLFWKGLDGKDRQKIPKLDPLQLEKHPKNGLGHDILDWKSRMAKKLEENNIPKAVASGNWKFISESLKSAIRWGYTEDLVALLKLCDEASAKIRRHPVESRYPVLKAVTLLEKNDKDTLIAIITGPECSEIRGLAIVDSILLMLRNDIPSDWLSRQAPALKDRSVWIVSSEVWNAGGGLGRVEQSHAIGFASLLKQEGLPLNTCEGYYAKTIDKKTGLETDTDYPSLLGVRPEDIKEVDRFEVPMGSSSALAVCYMAVNKFGIKSYLIKGYRDGQSEKDIPYYTERLYHYRSKEEQDPGLVTLEGFSVFFSRASLELTRRMEAPKRASSGDGYLPPVMHFNDGQLGFAPVFRKVYYDKDPVLGNAMIGFSTHTYPNRCWMDKKTGEANLNNFGVPFEAWKYFYRHYENIIDQTSGGVRASDWRAGVSAKHVDDILSYKYDNWKDDRGVNNWEYVGQTMVSVTNGDVRSITARIFRKIMLKLFPDADVEEPTPQQVLATKREAKKLLELNPDQPVVSYSGRIAREKASRDRAFCDANIEEMVKSGIQVVIGANVASNKEIATRIEGLAILADTIKRKKALKPDVYKGDFILMCNVDVEGQRSILAATDIQIQDSDENTEAAGYSEADVAVCGGLEMAPPWREGILQSQGIPINMEIRGEGNTIIPKDSNPGSYLEAIRSVLKLYPEQLSEYQANAIRLSRILEATLTSAEYLRQWSDSAMSKDEAFAKSRQVAQAATVKGSIKNCLDAIFNSSLRIKSDISAKDDLLPKRKKTADTVYSLRTVQEEVRILMALGILEKGTLPHTYRLRSQIRNLSPPELEKILSIPELDKWTIAKDKIPALRQQIEKLVSEIYNARSKDVIITSASDFAKTSAAKVADEIRRLQRERPEKDVTMVFATGRTMIEYLNELSRQKGIDWTRFQAYHLDEYKGLGVEHPASFAYFLNKNLFSKVPIPRQNIHYVAEYVAAHGRDEGFKKYLADMGDPDISMLGIGMDGHLAFNEPPKYSSFDSAMQEISLDGSTVEANKPDYPELETDPSTRFAYTMGMADIFRSGKIFFLANGSRKSGIVSKAIAGDVTEDVGGSMLQMHPNVTWILDDDAADGKVRTVYFNSFKTVGSVAKLEAFYHYAIKNELDHKEIISVLGPELKDMMGVLRQANPQDELTILSENKNLSGRDKKLDILRAVSELTLQLVPEKPDVDNDAQLARIKMIFVRNPDIARLMIKYFETKFDLNEEMLVRGELARGIREKEIEPAIASLADAYDRDTLKVILAILKATVKTDYNLESRSDLMLRIDPQGIKEYDKMDNFKGATPFGIIWVHVPYGAYGAHVRYEDVARGGIRMLNPDRPNLRNKGLAECSALAFTQNNKHIDIPEAGSKGVFAHWKNLNSIACAMGFVQGLINCMKSDEKIVVASGAEQVDSLELGPDEGTAPMATIATVLAYIEGLEDWRLLMTGKLDALGGVDHKSNNLLEPARRGNRVTSQGVMTHAFEMMRYLIDKGIVVPDGGVMKFSITGGPNGDVASGEIDNLIRRYGENAHILSMCDVDAVAFDPTGLPNRELTRLYDGDLPLSEFDRANLGEGGFLVNVKKGTGVDSYVTLEKNTLRHFNTTAFNPEILKTPGFENRYKTQAGILNTGAKLFDVLERDETGAPSRVMVHTAYLRDTIFFLTKADMLITGGGVRNSIDNNSWQLFFDKDGKPTTKAIVHGANVFASSVASNALESRGVVIEPDEKANSVGVEISSRMEVDFNIIFPMEEVNKNLMRSYFQQVLIKCLDNAKAKFWALRIEAEKKAGESVVTKVSPMMSEEIIRLAGVIKNSHIVRDGTSKYDPIIMEYIKRYFPDVSALDNKYDSTVVRVLDSMRAGRVRAIVSKMIAKEAVLNLGMGVVAGIKKSTDRSEADVIRSYMEKAKDLNIEARKKEIVDNKEGLTPTQQMEKMAALRVELGAAIEGKSVEEEKVTAVTADQKTIMELINKINLECIPSIDVGKTIWHVIPISLIPHEQRPMFMEAAGEINRSGSREKIQIITEKQDMVAEVERLRQNSNNIPLVALTNSADIEKLRGDVKMLVFEAEDGKIGNFRQLESIFAALRTLYTYRDDPARRNDVLSRIYGILTGKVLSAISLATDPKEFARQFKFVMPAVEVADSGRLESLNKALKEFLIRA